MKKTILLLSSKAITLNNFFDVIISNKKYNFILGSTDPENLKFKNLKVKLFLDFKLIKIINPLFFFSNLIKNFFILKKLKYDYIIINTPLAALYFRIIGYLLKKKYIYIVHGFRFHRSERSVKSIFFKTYEKLFSIITSHYIILNKEDLKVILNNFNKPKENILSIPSIGISYKKLIKIKTKKKDINFNVGIISAYRDNKGYPDLIKIAAKLQKNKINIKFHCYGYDNKERYSQKIKRLKLNNVMLNNYSNNIHDKIKYFDLVCHLSRREGMPISLLETITIGVPVIAYDIRGNNDIIVNNFNGILVKPYDASDFENRLIKLYKDPKKLKLLQKNCKKSVKQYHDKKNISSMISNFIDNVE